MPSGRAFFLGAGASRADGFPLTSDIIYGVAAALTGDPKAYERVLRFLQSVFRTTDDELSRGAERWRLFVNSPDRAAPGQDDLILPDIVELLSLIDVLIADESLVAVSDDGGKGEARAFSARELSRVRESISRAIASAFRELAGHRSRALREGATVALASSLSADDVVITTNWDLLLDVTLHGRFGTDASAVGSDVIVVDKSGRAARPADRPPRPPLFKLHGSLNWLGCLRCTRLYVNPIYHIAELGFRGNRRRNEGSSCDCGMPLHALLITPTYFKQYRNRHLANIWAQAQQRLAACDEWYFAGYSLPTDDVHIRAFLLRALHMRLDETQGEPAVTVVTRGEDQGTIARFRRLFRNVGVDPRGFAAFAAGIAPEDGPGTSKTAHSFPVCPGGG